MSMSSASTDLDNAVDEAGARIPAPRTRNGGRTAQPEPVGAAPPVAPADTESRASTRTRGLRAWMVAAPVDAAALLFPLLLTDRYWRGTLFMAGLAVAVFAAGGHYRPRRHVSVLDELPGLCGRLLASAGVVAIIAAMRHDSVDYVSGLMRWVAFSAALVIAGRSITRTMVVFARRRRWVSHNALVVGSGPVAVELSRLLRLNPRYGLRFVGCVDDPPAAEGSLPAGDTPAGGEPLVVGTLAEIEQAIKAVGADVLVVAEPRCTEAALMELLRRPGCVACDLWMVPLLWGSRSQGRVPDHIGAIPVVHIRHTTFGGPRWALKRASDVVVASLTLLVLSPVFALCAIATRLAVGPGIFFRQERIGRHGKPFEVIKFRTLRANDADADTRWSIADDDRVPAVGRFLRRTSLDELPQFWNILRGDMTVVGPRPERPHFVEKFSAELPEYAMRHRVPVGLTGLAQVSGLRGNTPISDRARFDNYYIENWSLWLDVKVVLRTLAEVVRGSGR